MTGPLTGLRVWVTRPLPRALASAKAWNQAGADAATVPLIRFISQELSPQDVRRLAALSRPWNTVLTSQNAARYFLEALRPHPELLAAAKTSVCRVVGEATATGAAALGYAVAATASRATGADLASLLIGQLRPGDVVVLPGSDLQRLEVARELAGEGIDVTSLVVYRTLAVSSIDAAFAAELAFEPGPLILLYSPSAVHALAKVLAGEAVGPARIRTAVVGPTTREAADEVGLKVVAAPDDPGEAALIESVAAWWNTESAKHDPD